MKLFIFLFIGIILLTGFFYWNNEIGKKARQDIKDQELQQEINLKIFCDYDEAINSSLENKSLIIINSIKSQIVLNNITESYKFVECWRLFGLEYQLINFSTEKYQKIAPSIKLDDGYWHLVNFDMGEKEQIELFKTKFDRAGNII